MMDTSPEPESDMEDMNPYTKAKIPPESPQLLDADSDSASDVDSDLDDDMRMQLKLLTATSITRMKTWMTIR
jgi:hypothetical protein